MNVYEIVTERIVSLLEAGTVPWRKPWRGDDELPANLRSQRPYRGINVFLLGCAPFGSRWWLTYKQAAELGGQVRKGEKGYPVVFWRWLERGAASVDSDSDDAPARGRVPVVRYYTVFNAEQCEGLTVPDAPPVVAPFEPHDRCEAIVRGMPSPPSIRHGGAMAFYRPSDDSVTLPPQTQFVSSTAYYSTLFHELGHATGHSQRLARKGVTEPARFASHEYSREELVAEMTSAFLCGHAGIEPATLGDSASYLASWLQVLRADTKLVVQAAASAQKAADLILDRPAFGADVAA